MSPTRAEVALFGFVYDLGPPTRFSLELDGRPTVGELLEHLVRHAGERLRARLFTAAGGLQPGVQVFVERETRSLDERLPESPRVAVKIVVLHTTAGG
ncbi:MAG: hypothetical protein QN152_10785 [Armatimonadota bacterium]|nr:hypothetical protein [Armatimonadota bacterium]